MNILLNSLSAISGGAQSYLINLIPELHALFEKSTKHHLTILTHKSTKQLLFPTIPDSQCILLSEPPLLGYRRLLWEYQHLSQIVHEQKTEVLFIPYQIGPKITGVKQVLMFRNMEPFLSHQYRYSIKSRLRNHLLKFQSYRALQAADRVIAVSEYVKDTAISQLNIALNQIRIIYHGRDKSFSSKGSWDADRKLLSRLGLNGNYILTVGSLLPYRRCEDVIMAFSSVVTDELKLVIAGTGSDARYAQFINEMIKKSGQGDKILAVGHVSRELMRVLYRYCHLCVIATEIEACPNIAIEAMSSGCVIISSNHPPLPEIFNGCSMEFRSRDIDDLAFKIQTALKDDSLCNELKSSALNRAQFFSWTKCAEKTYQALINW